MRSSRLLSLAGAVATLFGALACFPQPLPAAEAAKEVAALMQKCYALTEKDLAQAVKYAAQAKAAAEAGLLASDPTRARALMLHAYCTARLAVSKSVPEWQNRQVFLAQGKAAEAEASLKALRKQLDSARQWAAYGIKMAERVDVRGAPIVPADDALSLGLLQLAGETEFRAEEFDAAAAFYQAAADRSQGVGPGAPAFELRIDSLIMLQAASGRRHKLVPAQSARALAELARTKHGRQAELQQMVFTQHVFESMLPKYQQQLEKTPDAADRIGQEFTAELDAFQKVLTAAGVQPSVASLGQIALANFYYGAGRYAEVDRVLAGIEKTVLGRDVGPIFRALFRNVRGLRNSDLSNFAAARADFEEVLRITKQLNLAPLVAQANNNLGQLALKQGDYPTAERRLSDADKQYAALGPQSGHVYTLVNLGKAIENGSSRNRKLAATKYEAALAKIDPARPDRRAECICLAALGVNQYNLGKFTEAEKYFQSFLAVAEKHFGAGHLHTAEANVDLGWAQLAQGQAEPAEKHFLRALDIVTKGEGRDHPRAAEIMTYLARTHAQLKRPEDARQMLREAIALREQHMDRLLSTALSERDRLSVVQELRVHPESVAWPGAFDTFLELAPGLELPVAEQYRAVLAWKGAVARQTPALAGKLASDPAIQRLAQQREQALQKLRATFITKPAAKDRQAWSDQIAAAEKQLNDLEIQLRSLKVFLRSSDAGVLEPAAVAALLPAGSALLDVIEFRVFLDRKPGKAIDDKAAYIGFLVRQDGSVARIELGESDKIRVAVDNGWKAFQAASDSKRPAAALTSLLRDPLQNHLTGVKLLIVAGDGRLHRLPLAALQASGGGSYWVEQMAFATVPSAYSLRKRTAASTRQKANQGLLVVGGVDYGSAKSSWDPLPGSGREAQAVRGIYQRTFPKEPVTLLEGARPTPSTVLAGMARCKFAHLATHGSFKEQQEQGFELPDIFAQLDSALVLAADQPNALLGDHYLTAGELGQQDLRGVDLVTLSACNTGRGAITSGQGQVGLITALDQAGARTVITSLWAINDKATELFMQTFYQHLWSEGLSPPEALRAAQRDFISGKVRGAKDAKLDNPYYWAAFVVTGGF